MGMQDRDWYRDLQKERAKKQKALPFRATSNTSGLTRGLKMAPLGIILFWAVVMGCLYIAMNHYLKPKQAVVSSNGDLVIPRSRDGHFYAQGEVNGQRYLLGNHRLVHEQGLCSDALEARLAALETQGKTVVLLAHEKQVIALFAVADTVKESSRQAIQELQALGIQTVMLTGDNAHTAQAIASQVGILEAHGDLLPEDKLKFIESKIGPDGAVGMVGDGINDAPALARADIGFAMGAAGSGTAIETADVALMDDDLRKLPRFIRLSRATHTLLVQNIALALGIKAVFLVLTLVGSGTMWMAVFADVGASLLVVGNGLRLLRFK